MKSIDRTKEDVTRMLGSNEDTVWTRLRIDEVQADAPHRLHDLFRISIFERAQDRPPNERCFGYILGDITESHWHEKLLKTYSPIDLRETDLLEDDIIVYCRKFGPTMEEGVHIGRVDANGEDIISKWGRGHVYIHKPLHVPTIYGTVLHFLRRKIEHEVSD